MTVANPFNPMTNHIVYATDENYWMPLYVSVYSLLQNNKESKFNIFILSKSKNSEFFNYIGELNNIHNYFTVEFVKINDSDFATAPEPNWFSEGIYYRLLINSLLPITDKNVLYLDCDTLICGSIKELLRTDINDSIVAATPEFHNRSFWMGLPVDAQQYNTGVMYINLEQWRKYNIEDKALEYIKKNNNLKFPLQEIINTIIHNEGMWKTLSPKYNAMIGEWIGTEDSQVWKRDIDPRIIHYCGASKPWLYKSNVPYKDCWWSYLEKTPYKNYQPPDKSLSNLISKQQRLAENFVSTKLEKYPLIHEKTKYIYKHLFR